MDAPAASEAGLQPLMRPGVDVVRLELTSTALIRKWADGLLSYDPLPHVTEHRLADLVVDFEAMMRVQAGARSVFVTDGRQMRTIGKAEIQFISSRLPDFATHAAFVGGTPISRFLFNLFMRIRPAPIPNVQFASHAEALEWLARL